MNQLYRHFDITGNLLYIGISLNAISRLSQHKNSRWIDKIAKVEIENFNSRQEVVDAEIKAIKSENPSYNIIHNKESKKPYTKIERDITLSKHSRRDFTPTENGKWIQIPDDIAKSYFPSKAIAHISGLSIWQETT